MKRLSDLPKIKWFKGHLFRVVYIILALTAISCLGLPATYLLGGGLTKDPLTWATLTVILMIPALSAMFLIPILASHFLAVLYDIKSPKAAYGLLCRLVLGPWTFAQHIRFAEAKVARGEGTILHRIGGPGYTVIYNDTAVVTQRCGRLWRVLGSRDGFPLLERFEKVWMIIDLRNQHRTVTVKGYTREGIPVECDVDLSFKIDDRDENGRIIPPSDEEPYPYTKEAVLRAAASRRIWGPEKADMEWPNRVIGMVEGILRGMINERRLDWLLAPTESDTQHPREIISRRLEEELAAGVKGIGVRLLRLELGEFRVPVEGVSQQWIKAWQAEWESRDIVTHMEGEAELLQMDIAQAQAQAEVILSLIQALQSVAATEDELRPYMMATRFVHTLRQLTYDPYSRAFLPPEATQTLKRLQDALGIEQPQLPGEAGSGEEK